MWRCFSSTTSFVCGNASDDPPVAAADFTAKVIVLDHPGSIMVGYAPILDCHTAHICCQFKEISAKLDRFTGEVVQENPRHVRKGDACLVTLKPTKPLTAGQKFASALSRP